MKNQQIVFSRAERKIQEEARKRVENRLKLTELQFRNLAINKKLDALGVRNEEEAVAKGCFKEWMALADEGCSLYWQIRQLKETMGIT